VAALELHVVRVFGWRHRSMAPPRAACFAFALATVQVLRWLGGHMHRPLTPADAEPAAR